MILGPQSGTRKRLDKAVGRNIQKLNKDVHCIPLIISESECIFVPKISNFDVSVKLGIIDTRDQSSVYV